MIAPSDRTPQTAAAQLRRILDMIPRLADGQPRKLEEIMAITGADLRSVIADLGSLAGRFDAPAGFVEGVTYLQEGDEVEIVARHFLRPMRLTMAELCALELGLSILRQQQPEVERGPIDRALGRLRQAISHAPADEGMRDWRYAELGDERLAAHHGVLREARMRGRKARITYRGSADTTPVERTVRPYALVHIRGTWYAIAFCERSDDVRFFRLDRLERAELTDDAYDVPEDFTPDALVRDGRLFRAEEAGTMRVRYSPRIARWIAEREGHALDADGSLTLEHPLADTGWAVRHVLQYGADAEVLEPAELRAEIVGRLREMLS